jgi:hypothetical protein
MEIAVLEQERASYGELGGSIQEEVCGDAQGDKVPLSYLEWRESRPALISAFLLQRFYSNFKATNCSI